MQIETQKATRTDLNQKAQQQIQILKAQWQSKPQEQQKHIETLTASDNGWVLHERTHKYIIRAKPKLPKDL